MMISLLPGLGDNLHSAVIALDAVWMLDLDGVQALQEIVEEFSRTGLRVFLAGVHLVNTTGAIRPSFGGDMSQHGLGLTNDASAIGSPRSRSFQGLGPLTHGGEDTSGSSSKCLPPHVPVFPSVGRRRAHCHRDRHQSAHTTDFLSGNCN